MSTALRAGTAIVDITPSLGSSLAGYLQDRHAELIHDPLHARCLVLESGETKVAIAICDLVAIGNDQVSAARHLIHGHTGIPLHNMLIAATHTHTGATPVPIFQSDPDPKYLDWLVTRIADGVRCAAKNLTPVRVGWATAQEPTLVFNRRYYMKPGSDVRSPYGATEKVRMNPGHLNPAIDKPAGPTDPELSMLAFQTPEGRPFAVLASYALHYVGGNPENDISADYFAMWAQEVSRGLSQCCEPGGQERTGFLAILANGCSGNINNIDFLSKPASQPYPYHHMREVAQQLAQHAIDAWPKIQFTDAAQIAIAQATVELSVRKPTAEGLANAKKILAESGPKLVSFPQVYARESVLLAEYPEKVNVPVMAIRIGDAAMVTFPGEAFVELGLEVKKKSPFAKTMCIELANGFFGYIPTAEQHALGGYETWRARSSLLEVSAAEKLVQTALRLLNELRGSPISAPA